MKHLLIDFIALLIFASVLASAFGYSDGKKMQTKQEKFRESVYKQNIKWCQKHPRYCTTKV